MKFYSLILLLMCYVYSIHVSGQETIEELKNEYAVSVGEEKIQLGLKLAFKLRDINADEAETFALEILKESKKNGKKEYIANAESICAQIYSEKQQYTKSLNHAKEASALFSELKDRKNVGFIESLKGDNMKKLGLMKGALSSYEQAYKVFKELHKKKAAYTAIDIGKIYEAKEDYENALIWYKRAVPLFEHVESRQNEITSLILIATVYNNYGDYVKAEEYYNRSLEKAKIYNMSDEVSKINDRLAIVAKNKEGKQVVSTRFDEKQEIKREDHVKNMENKVAKSLEEIELLSTEKQLVELKIKAQQDDYEKQLLQEKLNVIEAKEKLRREQIKKEKIALELVNERLISENKKMQNQRLLISVSLLSVISILLIVGFYIKRKNNIQLTEKNNQIVLQNKTIELKNASINQSITYAHRIQKVLLPHRKALSAIFPDSFVYLNPKDKVSGDFAWSYEYNKMVLVCAADCTGHGVPGAFMSVFFNNILDFLVKGQKIFSPNDILESIADYLHNKVVDSGYDVIDFKDGMDAAIISVDKNTGLLTFSGAKNPVYIIRKGEFIELKPTKRSVEVNQNIDQPFKKIEFNLQKGDNIYMFSDGFPDQKGGAENRKFYYPPFQHFLQEISEKPMKEQRLIIGEKFTQWKGDNEQVDDVLLLGIKY